MYVECMSLFIDGISFFFFKQKTAYEMRISDWSSDVCSSDLRFGRRPEERIRHPRGVDDLGVAHRAVGVHANTDLDQQRSAFLGAGRDQPAALDLLTDRIHLRYRPRPTGVEVPLPHSRLAGLWRLLRRLGALRGGPPPLLDGLQPI